MYVDIIRFDVYYDEVIAAQYTGTGEQQTLRMSNKFHAHTSS